MIFKVQCGLVFMLAFLADIIWSWHIKSLLANETVIAISTVIVLHFLGYCQQAWFIDHKTTSCRLGITLAAALGASLSCLVVIWISLGH